MLKRLFYKPAGIEIRPDGARVQKWERRSLRVWLLFKLIGNWRVLANLDLTGQQITIKGGEKTVLFRNTLGGEGRLTIG